MWQRLADVLSALFERGVAWKEARLVSFLQLPVVRSVFRYISPNDLCYLRIMASVAILFLYMRNLFDWLFPVFVLAVLCDLIDGPLARSTGRITEEGKKLDPIADKVLISVPFLVIGIGRFGNQTVAMFLLSEGLLVLVANYLKPYLREKYGIPLTSGANVFGQTKMTLQSLGIGALLYNPLSNFWVGLAESLIWLAIIFSIFSLLRHLARLDRVVAPEKRIITVPTLITLSGIFILIPAGFALFRQEWWLAGILIGWIFVSDWLDGWIARRYNQVTRFGAAIDPLRDYLGRFLVAAWVFFQLDMPFAQLAITAIVTVEIVTGLVNINTAKRCQTVLLVNAWGKARGVGHYILLGVIFLHCARLVRLPDIWLGLVFFLIFLFSLFALLSYVDQRRRLLQQKLN